jgi:hypothetical protein
VFADLGKVTDRASERPKDGQHERDSAGCADPSGDSGARPAREAADRQVLKERVEVAIRPGCGDRSEPLLKLACTEPPLDRRVA